MASTAESEFGEGAPHAPDARARVEKHPGAYRTITEVADDLGIPQHVLRFWETRFAQVRPVKRAGGRRYYRPDDIEILKGVRGLLHGQGYTIKGVQLIFREKGARFVQALGRGEAEAGVPLRGREVEDDPEPSGDDRVALREDVREAGREVLSEVSRESLRGALDDLVACRDALAALLGAPPDPSDADTDGPAV